ncbi:MAG: hypothetical protein AAGA05_01840 [Pseudomonadota bacterium]
MIAAGLGRVAQAEEIWEPARNFSESELAILGLRVARSMVQTDCKGRVFWAETPLGKSGYAAGYETLRNEGYNKREMRNFASRNIVDLQAFGMWMSDGGINLSNGSLSQDKICGYVQKIAGTDHAMGRFLSTTR